MEEKEESIGQRIRAMLRHAHISQRGFAEMVGAPQSSIAAVLSHKGSKPGFELIQKILTAFPHISADWLLLGKGHMISDGRILVSIASADPESGQQPTLPALPFSVEIQQAELTMLRAQLEHQKAQIDYLMKRVAELSK